MNLAHRLAMFTGLTPSNPADYGFTTTQCSIDPFTPGDIDAVVSYVEHVPLELNVLLAFNPKANNLLFTGTVAEEWYGTIQAEINGLVGRLGARVAGVRWNHEYRSSLFPANAAWDTWMRQKNMALHTYICLYQKTKWLQLLSDTKSAVHPVAFLEKTTNTPYDGPMWTDFRTVFRLWCQYQCQREAVVINRLAEISNSYGLPFYLYPGGKSSYWSPRMMPELEYTVEHTITNPDTVILEAGGWSTRDQRWLDGVTSTIAQPFIWTNQLDLSALSMANPEQEYNSRMGTPNALGHCAQGFGFWSDWQPSSQPEYQVAMQGYMDRLRLVLA